MTANERTSDRVASIAARGLDDPCSLSADEIRTVCASALTQAPDHSLPALSAHAYYSSPGLGYLAATRNALSEGKPTLAKVLLQEYGTGSLAPAGLSATKHFR